MTIVPGARPVLAQGSANPYIFTTLAGLPSAGSLDGAGSLAQFNQPMSVATDTTGTVYVADRFNNTIRKITSSGVATTFAGTAGSCGSADGVGAAARFCFPDGIAVDGVAHPVSRPASTT